MTPVRKTVLIGLDCAEPTLILEKWRNDLPNLDRLMDHGMYGNLTSCVPPITVPAWSCMASSKDPGTLGIYGFRNRKDHTYEGLSIATSLAVKEPRIWDVFYRAGMHSIVVGVPGTFPIWRPVRGTMVTCFLTPGIDSDYTHPKELKQEIAELVGEYMVDVKGFRTDNKQWLLDQIYEMTDKRFKVLGHLMTTKPWDLVWMVEMGTDRIHHGFWQFMDPAHHRYQPGNPFENAIHDYYVHVDKLIGTLLERIDMNETAVWVVSDHGAKCMVGGVCFNDWLIREGYLTLKEPLADGPKRFSFDMVDWTRTRVWGEGGYYGRCFINLKGREPQGIVQPTEYESLRAEIIRKLEGMNDHCNEPMGTHVHKPQDVYRRVNGVAPDLIVIFGDLRWRSVGSVGNRDIYTFENDTGPDDANHAQQGMYILTHPSVAGRGRMDDATIYDVAPTTLDIMGLPIQEDMQGKSIL